MTKISNQNKSNFYLNTFILLLPFLGIIYYIPFIIAIEKLIISLLSIMLLLYIKQYLYKNYIVKILFYFSYAIIILIYFLEAANYKITGKTFKYSFWDTLLNKNIIYSFNTYIYEYTIVFFIIILFLFIYFLSVNKKMPPLTKEKLIKRILLLFLFQIFMIKSNHNPFFSFLYSYKQYYTINSYMHSKQVQNFDQIPIFDSLDVKAGKNLILIYVESLSHELFNDSIFPDLLPNLKKLSKNGLLLSNIKQEPLHFSTSLGMEMSQCGRITYLPIDENKSYCIGNVFNKANYYQVYINGGNLEFGHKGDLYKSMDYDEILGINEIIEVDPLYKKFKGGWGIVDEGIFDFAYTKFLELENKNQPFVLTILTQDGHDGISSELCNKIDQYKGSGDNNKLVKSFHCNDYLIGEFIKKISKSKKYQNTVIAILGDHIMHETLIYIKNNSEKIFGLIINSDTTGIYNQRTTLADFAPTILDLLKVKTNAKFYDGKNILSKNNKLRNINLIDAPIQIQEFFGYNPQNFIIPVQKHNINELKKYFITNKIKPIKIKDDIIIYYQETESLKYKNIIILYHDLNCDNIYEGGKIFLELVQKNKFNTSLEFDLIEENYQKNLDGCYMTTQFVVGSKNNFIKNINIQYMQLNKENKNYISIWNTNLYP